MGDQEDSSLPPHVLIFPLPIQGHVNSMLRLAKLLCLAGGIHVTFLVSDFVHHRLLRHSSSSLRHPSLRLRTVSDGLPADHPRAGARVMEIVPAIKKVTAPMFRDMMVNSDCLRSGDRRPVTCIIADGVLSFAGDFALERGIPLLYFRTVSACSFWACFCFQEVIDAGEVPIKGNGMDLPVKSVPGMEVVLRRRDLPSFCRVDDISDPGFQVANTVTRQTPRAQAVILNTFEALEASVLRHIRGSMPNLFTIGPLHSLLHTKAADITAATSGSFWEEDRSCMKWLDAQPAKSVIYVSFGSLTVVTREQLVEFWHGLVNSGQQFLWVMRPDSVVGQDGGSQVPAELAKATEERGYIVGWAPQEEVLNHPAIGGFLTHSGWNSTLESMVAGVPMICWPMFADQTVNSRFVGEAWKLGLDMKDTCDRVTIEKMVRDLMVVRKDEFVQSANRMTQLAREAVSEGGSSYCNLNRLIEYIRSMVGQVEACPILESGLSGHPSPVL